MFKFRMSSLPILAAGASALVLATGAVAAAPEKPLHRAPAPAIAAPALHGARAALDARTPTASEVRALASQDGSCDVGELCLYYLSVAGGLGSRYDTAHNDPNLNNNRFITSGAGQWQTVGNNFEAYWNRDPHAYAWICTGTNNTGTCGYLPPNTIGSLPATFSNNSESLYWQDQAN